MELQDFTKDTQAKFGFEAIAADTELAQQIQKQLIRLYLL